ncbi:MAG: PEGA domain-containing protein [Proteobacteria bacterium]|nr:PEGA domain-containing protein [Pseudomonadota bacterium]
MKGATINCTRALEIDLRLAQELVVSPDDTCFHDEHMATCPDCLLESEALKVMADDETSGALPDLDDLTRRRFVDSIITQAEELSLETREEMTGTHTRDKPGRIRAIALTATLAAASVAAVLFWTSNASWPTKQQSLTPPAIIEPTTSLNGQFVLLTGQVDVESQAAAISDRLLPGDHLETIEGRAVVSLPTGIVMSLSPQTRLAVHKNKDSAIEVLFDKGEVQFSVDPDQKRPGLSVITSKGRIEVKGTVFSVKADEISVEVRVLSGELLIADRGGRQRRLGTRGATALGSTRTWMLSKDEEESLWEKVRAVELLSPEENTVVDIQSTPQNATVTIDSVVLGKTPVKAAVRAGYRELALALNGKQVARKLIDLHAGTHLSLDMDLTEAETEDLSDNPDSEREHASVGSRKLSSQELLLKAQSLREDRDWAGAARVYQKVIRQYPNSDEARASFVSLGEIQLVKLDKPTSALRKFDNYLSRVKKGPLAQEALFGKARAFRALKRPGDEQKALDLFLTRFPSAIQAREVRERLAELNSASE